MTDPVHGGRPLESTWSELIKERALAAVTHADRLHHSIIENRLKAITDVQHFYDPHMDSIYCFTDKETKYTWAKAQLGCKERARPQCIQARQAHILEITAQMTKKLEGVSTSIKAWKELALHPLPRPELITMT